MKKMFKSILGATLICGSFLVANNQEVDAVTNSTSASGIVRVTYNGRGKVRLLNANGAYQNQYVGKNTNWKVFEQASINGQDMYRIGTQNQWIPAHFTNRKTTTTSSTVVKNDLYSSATNRKKVSGIATIVYNGKGKVRLLNSNGQYQDQYVANKTNWKVFEQATINDQTMYRLGSENQWVPAHYTKLNVNVAKHVDQVAPTKTTKPNTKPNRQITKPTQQVTKHSDYNEDGSFNGAIAANNLMHAYGTWRMNHPAEVVYEGWDGPTGFKNDPGFKGASPKTVLNVLQQGQLFDQAAVDAYNAGPAAYKAYITNWEKQHPQYMQDSAVQHDIHKYGFNNSFYF